MPRFVSCRICRMEFARIGLSGGSAALLCIDCDLIGLEREVVQGGPVMPGGQPRRRAAGKAAAGRNAKPKAGPRAA